MINSLKKYVNLDRALLLIIIALLKFEAGRLYDKLDILTASNMDLVQRVSRLEGAVGLTSAPPKGTNKP